MEKCNSLYALRSPAPLAACLDRGMWAVAWLRLVLWPCLAPIARHIGVGLREADGWNGIFTLSPSRLAGAVPSHARTSSSFLASRLQSVQGLQAGDGLKHEAVAAQPLELPAPQAGPPDTAPESVGRSAWDGDGSSFLWTEDGKLLRWFFHAERELAMGGPIDGSLILTGDPEIGRFAFCNVGSSFVISSDARFMAAPRPSRSGWTLLLVDLRHRKAWEIDRICCPQELDSFDRHMLKARRPAPANHGRRQYSASELQTLGTLRPLIQDDGWWVEDSPARKPLPRHNVRAFSSPDLQHKLLLVPHVEAFETNPFLRQDEPGYSVVLNDHLLPDLFLQPCRQAPAVTWLTDAAAGKTWLTLNLTLLDCSAPGSSRKDSSALRPALLRRDAHAKPYADVQNTVQANETGGRFFVDAWLSHRVYHADSPHSSEWPHSRSFYADDAIPEG